MGRNRLRTYKDEGGKRNANGEGCARVNWFTKIRVRHGSAGGIRAPLEIVAEAPFGLDAHLACRFAWPLPFNTRTRKRPVCDCPLRPTCSAVPVAPTFPPCPPPSAPSRAI